jgi:N-acyl-D-aspartate/D-glutamate deacylase
MASMLLYATENLDFSDRSFDAETTAIVKRAFDSACKELGDDRQAECLQKLVGKRLIAIAASGGRDPIKMCDDALISLGFKPNRFTISPRNSPDDSAQRVLTLAWHESEAAKCSGVLKGNRPGWIRL